MSTFSPWDAADCADWLAVPTVDDDKYSRGVLGFVTGSDEYPGAAVLGVEAALHTGVGMVRYLGPTRAADLVLQRRPEAVTQPGRVQAWVIGSGMDQGRRDAETAGRLRAALADGVPTVVDAGTLDLAAEAAGPALLTPHARELARLLGADASDIAAEPARWCERAAGETGATVLLKGSRTHVASPGGTRLVTPPASGWLATAGTGDALAGVIGALLATHAKRLAADPDALARLAATGAVIHARAAARLRGPFPVLELIRQLPAVVADLLPR